MTKKRRQIYRPPRPSKGPAAPYTPPAVPPTVALINRDATSGRTDIEVGMRVTVQGTGLYAGEAAVVESISGGVIPAADIRTDAGRARRVRTIDLVPLHPATPAPDLTRAPGSFDG